MKKYFITGLVILLPVTLTLAIVIWIFNLLTEPFAEFFRAILTYYGLVDKGFWSATVQKYFTQLIILFLLFFFTVGLGLLARWFFVYYLIDFWEHILKKIPFVSSVYKTCKDVIKTIFTTHTTSFKQVVLVPFPSSHTWAIGLVTKEDLPHPHVKKEKQMMTAVFVPTTPNPTSGFLMFFKENDLVYLDMKVEDALKYVISCGVITTPFTALTKEEAILRLKNNGVDKATESTHKKGHR